MTLDPTLKHNSFPSKHGQPDAELYGAILSAMAEGGLVHDSAGRIIYCNPSAEGILGLPAEQLIGKSFDDPLWRIVGEDGSPLPSGAHPVVITLRTGRPCRDEILGWTRPDSKIVWLSINSEPLSQPLGHNPG